MYTLRFRRAVYVLHAFQKKSNTGKKTPKHETELVNRRLRAAEEHYAEWLKSQPRKPMSETVTPSGGNVFADLGVPRPTLALAKANLALRLCEAVRTRQLTTIQAGKILKLPPDKVSGLILGKVAGFTLDRLITLLNRLDLDVEIAVKPAGSGRTDVILS